jgi:guanosine-3',5'-bis(diphosphate) 3'-pyrophosphohydrolase
MTIVEKADQLAERAHEGQTRKESGAPYITHPRAVAQMLKMHGFCDETVAAALVHDVVEDTPLTLEDVRRELGEKVAQLVEAVTYDDTLSWEDKRSKYIEAVRQASPDAKAISVADKIHNAQSFIAGYKAQGKDMWKNFNKGRDKKLWFEEEMLAMLRESWQHPLVEEYAALVEEMKALEY